jgi:uncharacterized protein (DUF433 family)
MAKPSTVRFPHIVRNPRILDGEPTVAGTRVPVRAIVELSRLYPDVTRLCQAFPMLDASLIEEALAYYAKHTPEIDSYIAENEANDEA